MDDERRAGQRSNPISLAVFGSLLAALSSLLLAIVIGGAYLYSYHTLQVQKSNEQRQGVLVVGKICHTLDAIAALEPPPGDPTANPSRAYEQQFHEVIVQLGPDLGCQRLRL
jgi:hypothetical protein